MKGAGWLGFILIGVGALLIWAGFQGVSAFAVVRAILSNEPVPRDGGGDGTTQDGNSTTQDGNGKRAAVLPKEGSS